MDRPIDWAKDSLSQFLEDAEANSLFSFVNFKDEFDRLRHINDLFRLLGENLSNTESWFSSLFFFRAHSAYLSAIRLATSGQLVEHSMVIRGCLENALYGYHVHIKPNAISLWLRRDESSKGRSAVRNEFKITSILKSLMLRDERIGTVARSLYERTIDYGAHPNEGGVLVQLRVLDIDDGKRFESDYFVRDPELVRLSMRGIAQVAICCLKIFELVFKERIGSLGMSDSIEKASRGL